MKPKIENLIIKFLTKEADLQQLQQLEMWSSNLKTELVSKMEIDHEGYKSIKGLILSAYLSSEIAMTQLFGYYPVPGRFDGCTSNRPW